MPMYEIRRAEMGTRYATYKVVADCEEAAKDLMWETAPEDEHFRELDLTEEVVRELDDCDCDVCERRFPWACVTEANEL